MIYYALLLFFVLEYVRPSSYVPALMVLKLNSIVPLGAFLGTLTTSGKPTLDRMLADRNTRIVAAFLFLVWISFLTADVQSFVWDCLMMILGFAIAYWVIGSEVNSAARLKGVFAALIVVHLIVAALNPVLFTDPNSRHYIATGSFLGDGNDFALSVDIIIPLCVFLLLSAKKSKPLWALALAVLVACVVLSQSRGGTVGLACTGLYYWMKSTKKLQTGILVVVVVALILAFAPSGYFQRMNMIADTEEGSAQARLEAWGAAVRMASDNPLLGVGAAHFVTKFGTDYRPKNVENTMTAHSIYFLALGELGVPGIVLLLYFIGSNLAANRRLALQIRAGNSATREDDLQMLSATSAALIAFATAGAFLSALYYPHLYVVGGLLSATRYVVGQRALDSAEAPVLATLPTVTWHPALRRPNAAAAGVRRIGR